MPPTLLARAGAESFEARPIRGRPAMTAEIMKSPEPSNSKVSSAHTFSQ